MTSARAVPYARIGFVRNVAGAPFHAACVAIVFAFVLVLTTGLHL